ncbi:hypothetical protein [Armatimonas rosea]|uniref:Uncharacterized protein n=1 Tax=Armatimonas rosea TaxID=685828 RepID=A0A7W9ST69_ARMRO|nr:hypothetical protein [Armatimonas rosea]MBB6051568.1 hypothetical protein [Armatimonas rosea]
MKQWSMEARIVTLFFLNVLVYAIFVARLWTTEFWVWSGEVNSYAIAKGINVLISLAFLGKPQAIYRFVIAYVGIAVLAASVGPLAYYHMGVLGLWRYLALELLFLGSVCYLGRSVFPAPTGRSLH